MTLTDGHRSRASLRRSRAAVAAALALGVALISGVLAPAAGADSVSGPGQFAISPARRIVVARPPVALAPTRVSNTTSVPYAVSVFPVLLRQDVTGAFSFSDAPQDLNAARLIVPVQPVSFTLAPGAARMVGLNWQLLPSHTRAAYIGVVFQGTPQAKAAGPVSVVDRLLSVNFLRLPGHFASGGAFTGLRVQQQDSTLDVLPRVENTGETVESPQNGRMKIVDQTGRVVYRTHWIGDVVLPRAQRDFTIPVAKTLPGGVYTAVATMRFGATRYARISNQFVLTGPNQLPTPRVALASLQGQGTIGGPAEATAQIRSVGTAPASTTVQLSLSATSGGAPVGNPIAQRSVSFTKLAPQSSQNLDVQLGTKLGRGDYRVTATYQDAPGSTQTLVTDFAATPARPSGVGHFVRIHWLAILLIAAAIAIVFLAVLMWRRQRKLQAELRALQQEARATNGHLAVDPERLRERETPGPRR